MSCRKIRWPEVYKQGELSKFMTLMRATWSRVLLKRFTKHHAGAGVMFGMMLIMVLTLSTTLICGKLSQGPEIRVSRSRLDTNKASGMNQLAWDSAVTYFKQLIEAGTTISAGASTSGNLTLPTNPSTLSGVSTIATYNATIEQKNGHYYWMRVSVTNNNSTSSMEKAFNYQDTTP
jgi:hypothetical protein